jgi:hypothetical protein
VFFTDRHRYAPDAVELGLDQPGAVSAQITQRAPEFDAFLQQRAADFEQAFGNQDERLKDISLAALRMAYARFAVRHGTWGEDLHQYHNEHHAMEIMDRRIKRLCAVVGANALSPQEWLLLTLFGGMHDLRQRETPNFELPVGANESASIDEATRILTTCGLDPVADEEFLTCLAMMIAGSTFDTRLHKPMLLTAAEAATAVGALAPTLVRELKKLQPEWEQQPALQRRVRMTLLASDLDTANVGEPLQLLGESAVRLCLERESRCNRADLGTSSALPCLQFLTAGQERYFFELHRFYSDLGERAFGPQKASNGPLVYEISRRIHQRFGVQPAADVTGREVVEMFVSLTRSLDAR